MAKQLPPHLSHKSALALLPPSTIAAPIEAVRRVHDRHFARWPPHINLLYPFLAYPSQVASAEQQGDDVKASGSPTLKDDIRKRIEAAVKHVQPFHMTLNPDPPGIFSHSKRSKTVWLPPSSEHVRHLQAALQAEFAECDVDSRPFTPHLSIGQATSDSGARTLGEAIVKSISEFVKEKQTGDSVALDWEVQHVFVIERKGFHDRFRVVGVVELGK